jgi:hypothetical protein
MDDEAFPSPAPGPTGNRPVDLWFKRLTFFSFLGGVAHLAPLPGVDDWLFNVVRRAMVRDLLTARGLQANDRQLKALVQGPATRLLQKGCLYAVLLPWRVLTYTLKRIFRKIFFVLAIKAAADYAVRLFQEGYLLDYAIRQGHLSPDAFSSDGLQVRKVGAALEMTNRLVDPHTVTGSMRLLFKGGRRALLQGLRFLIGITRRNGDPLPEQVIEERIRKGYNVDRVESFVDKMAAVLWNDPEYLARLEETFDRQIRRPPGN